MKQVWGVAVIGIILCLGGSAFAERKNCAPLLESRAGYISGAEADRIAAEYKTASVSRQSEILKRFMSGYTPLAMQVASRLARRNPEIDPDDLYQEALMGIYGALGTYNPDKGHFFPHVRTWMGAFAGRAVRQHYADKGVSLGGMFARRYFAQRAKILAKLDSLGASHSPENIHALWNEKFPAWAASLATVRRVEESYAFKSLYSLSQPSGSSGDDKDQLMDLIIEEDQEDSLHLLQQYESARVVRDAIPEFVLTLNPFEQLLFEKRIIPEFSGEDDGATLQELGKARNVSRERARQIQVAVMKRFKAFLEARGLTTH